MSTIVVKMINGAVYRHPHSSGRTHDGVLVVEPSGMYSPKETIHCYPLTSVENWQIER